jgi:putative peptide zinc metalloprotease protein
MYQIQPSSTTKIRTYQVTQTRDRYMIEIEGQSEFFELEKPGFEAIERLASGESIEEVQLALQGRYPEEEIEMTPFIQQLIEMGIVVSIDGQTLHTKQEEAKLKRGFLWIPVSLGRVFFHPITLCVYAGLLLFNLYHFMTAPHRFPSYVDLFPYSLLSANLITWLLLSLALLLIHEVGHVLALRSFDLPGGWRISNRLFFIVMETEMREIWRLPVRSRNIPYLGGMCMDQVVLFILLQVGNGLDASNTLMLGVVKIAIFQIVMMTIFQFMLFMKTDMYYVLENITGCHNLMENMKAWLKAKISGNLDALALFRGELRMIKVYSVIYVIGMCGMGGIFAAYYAPQMVYMISSSIGQLSNSRSSWQAIDSSMILLLVLAQVILLLYIWLSKWGKSRKN